MMKRLDPKLIDRVFFASFLVGVGALMFFWGAATILFKLPPYAALRDAKAAFSALREEKALVESEIPPYLYFQVDHDKRGLTIGTGKASPGYTAYSSSHEQSVHLLNLQGETVHRWHGSFNKIFADSEMAGKYRDDNIIIRRFHVFPNGDLVGSYETTIAAPCGLGMVKMNAKSEVIWRSEERFHHDIDVDDRGYVYGLTNYIRTSPSDHAPHLATPAIEEEVTLLDPSGRLVKKVSILKALANSPEYAAIILSIPERADGGDILHSNTVKLLGKEFAAQYPMFKPEQVLLCLREINTILILDLEAEKIVWGTGGMFWHKPHDPRGLPNGNILILDNRMRNNVPETNAEHSRAIEFDPITNAIVWSYGGTVDQPYLTQIRGHQQALPNGNVLLTESDPGRIFEVTRAGETVWEYINPARWRDDQRLIASVFGAIRYSGDELTFLQNVDGSLGSVP